MVFGKPILAKSPEGKMKFVHTNIVSSNWKTLVDFYVNTFDCKIKPPIRNQSGKWLELGTGLKNAKLEGAHLLLPGHGPEGPTLEIYQYGTIEDQPLVPPNKRGFSHIAFEVENVEAALERVIRNGGSANGSIIKRKVEDIGTITFVYSRDPEGNLIELQRWE